MPGRANMTGREATSIVAAVNAKVLVIAWAVAGLLAVGACGPTLPDYDYTKEPNPRRSEFVIGISDDLMITVWKNQQLTTAATVRPDGTITMPLVGDVSCWFFQTVIMRSS